MNWKVFFVLLAFFFGYAFYTNPPDITGFSVHTIPSLPDEDTTSLASFNIQTFGVKKMSNATIAEDIQTIIKHFDLVAIQEIRDKSGASIELLMAGFNESYDIVVSERLGRSVSKEQYAFIYRNDMFSVINATVWEDEEDLFEREPFIVYISYEDDVFAVMNVHLKPDDAEAEIHALQEVVEGHERWMVMGDFNADGSYFDERDTSGFREEQWIIEDYADTTVAASDNTYDRIVVKNIVVDEWGVYKNIDKKISDHYPVWITI